MTTSVRSVFSNDALCGLICFRAYAQLTEISRLTIGNNSILLVSSIKTFLTIQMRQITDRTLFNVSKRRQSAKFPTVLECQWRILVSELRNEEPRQGNKHDGVFQPQGRLQNWSHIADALVRCLRDRVLDTLLESRRIPDNIHCPGDDCWSGVLLLQPRAVAAVPDGQGLHHQHLQLQQHGRTGSGLVTVFPHPALYLSLSPLCLLR